LIIPKYKKNILIENKPLLKLSWNRPIIEFLLILLYIFTFVMLVDLLPTRDVMYRGKPLITRSYKNWAVVVRSNDPILNTIEQKKQMEYSEALKAYVLKVTDYSGKNHKLLVKPSNNDDYYEVLGSFTSSSTAHNGIHPDLICSYNLEDANKNQFFHRYLSTVFVKKTDVIFLQLETKVLDDFEYTKFCADIESKKI
jgi:hypothetical protein